MNGNMPKRKKVDNMDSSKENNSKIKRIANYITKLAKKKKAIKSLDDAFNENPVSLEVHKGRKEYYTS